MKTILRIREITYRHRHCYRQPTRSSLGRASHSSAKMPSKLRIGFVPEHFSTPLAFAQKHYELNAELIPFPTGTGALTSALKSTDTSEAIDVAIGLTEGFVADLGKTHAAGEKSLYGIVGAYVNSPLRWAISTGIDRKDLEVEKLKGTRVGVSRIGSGSYVMSYVLADQHGWLTDSKPFEVVPIGDFAALRRAVNQENKADFFMWEHFTTKHFWDNGELRRIGEIYTPWPSWMITARRSVPEENIRNMTDSINKGMKHYADNAEEAVQYITSAMHYSVEDAKEWMKTVSFPSNVHGVEGQVIDDTIRVLRKAGVLDEKAGDSKAMILATA